MTEQLNLYAPVAGPSILSVFVISMVLVIRYMTMLIWAKYKTNIALLKSWQKEEKITFAQERACLKNAVRSTMVDIMLTSASVSGAIAIRYYQMKRWLQSAVQSILEAKIPLWLGTTIATFSFSLGMTL